MALVKPLDPLHAITFTQDRALIRQVIAAFEGHAGDYTPRTEFERNFMSREPKTAEATRAQVVSAALQSLARRLGEQQQGRKALIFVSEGFRPAQPRAIVYAANQNGVALYPLDPHPEAADDESMLRSIAEQTGGAASINDSDLAPALAQAIADLDHYFVLSFSPAAPGDGRFHPGAGTRQTDGRAGTIAIGLLGAGRRARRRARESGGGAVCGAFRPSRSSPYIRPWIGMSRGPDGLTSVTVTWEPGAPPPRNQRVASILVKAIANDGTVLFEDRIGAGRCGPRGVQCAARLYRARDGDSEQQRNGARHRLSRHLRPEPAGHQAHVRDAAGVSDSNGARFRRRRARTPKPCPSRRAYFSRTERLLIRVPAYGPGNSSPIVTARLLNRRGIPMRQLEVVDASLPPGTVQFDLPLASLAPDEYRVELAAANATGTRDETKEILPFRVTN